MKKQIISALVAAAMIASTASAAFAEKIDVDNSFSMQAETEVELSASKGTYYQDLGLWFDAETGTITDADVSLYGSYTIPSQIDGVDVTSIGEDAFFFCRDLTSVTIPEGVKSIGNTAFSVCENLTSITIPDSVISIGDDAFYWCISLENITIPNSVTSIGKHAFDGCKSLTNITIPGSVISIGDEVFYNCTNLTSINVDSGNPNYSSLDGNLFNKDKTTLVQYAIGKADTQYSIPDSVTSIVGNAFYSCYNITSITVPAGVTNIDSSAFLYCKRLANINVDSDNPSYCSVDGNLFNKDKTTLVQYAIDKEDDRYTIPDSVTSIGDYAFFASYNLTSITIPESVITIGNWSFSDCLELSSITIPNSVKSLGNYAFNGCESLRSVVIPDSVTSIGKSAFFYCMGLRKVTIPSSVTSIGEHAFNLCDSLSVVYYTGTEDEWKQLGISEITNSGLLRATIRFLGDQSDIVICNVTENKSSCAVSANFQNNTDETQNFEAICAVYDEEGALITYEKESIEVAFGEGINVTFKLNASGWASFKLFAWDELGAMHPLSQI